MQTNIHQLLYLSQADVVSAGLSMAEIISSMERMFLAKGQGRTEMPPKPGIHPGGGDNFIHAMPAYISDLKSAGIKWVSGFPQNPKKGLPYISGLLIFNDAQTGLPLAVMDCVWITAKRTGAASAISARHLARPLADADILRVRYLFPAFPHAGRRAQLSPLRPALGKAVQNVPGAERA